MSRDRHDVTFHDSFVTDVTVVVIDDEHDEDEDADDGVCVTDSVPGSDLGTRGGAGSGEGSAYQVNIPETWRSRALCHMEYPDSGPGPGAPDRVGHWKVLPDNSMSRMRVSIGVLPTSLTKKSCSITEADTVLREGSLSNSLPNLVGWLGYWVLQYSSSAH